MFPRGLTLVNYGMRFGDFGRMHVTTRLLVVADNKQSVNPINPTL